MEKKVEVLDDECNECPEKGLLNCTVCKHRIDTEVPLGGNRIHLKTSGNPYPKGHKHRHWGSAK